MSARFYRCPHDGGGVDDGGDVGSGVDDGVVVGRVDDGGVGPGWGQREGARSGVEYTQLATQCNAAILGLQFTAAGTQRNTWIANQCTTVQHCTTQFAPQCNSATLGLQNIHRICICTSLVFALQLYLY